MTSFDISRDFLSHPNYPYINHIKNIAESFNDESHRETSEFHDIGKLCKAFQDYISKKTKKKTRHALTGAIIYMFYKNLEVTPQSFSVFISILKHHGFLPDINDLAYDILGDYGYLRDQNPDIDIKIKEVLTLVNSKINGDVKSFCDAFEHDNFVEEYNLSGIDNYFKIKEVFSKLVFSDKYEAIFKAPYNGETFGKAAEYRSRLLNLIKQKKNKLSEIRNRAREEIIKKYYLNIHKSIFLIEAPTGIGKTFIALQLALEIVMTKSKKRIINALPMTSIIDQTYSEYSDIIDSDELLKYHHLTNSKDYSDNNTKDYSEENQQDQRNDYLGSSWAMDKVIVTTFNQLLYSFYSNANRDIVKFWSLRDSVIIIDEIQAIPRILLKDFALTLNYLTKEMNIDFILMSATIPDIKGKGFLDQAVLSELLDNRYFNMDFNNRYSIEFDDSIKNIEQLRDAIIMKAKQFESVLCVVNTKKLSLELFEQLVKDFNEDELVLLNTNFIPIHRQEIIEEVKGRLKNTQRTILVSTQVVEAGVDIDFDYGFREFSPLYSIIQTAGRINREGAEHKRESAGLVVFNKIAYSPYHDNDLLHDIVREIIPDSIRENELLPFLKVYFETAIKRTQKESPLITRMEKLEFKSAFEYFNECFMKGLPHLQSIFIETEEGFYDSFIKQREVLLKKMEGRELGIKMNLKSQLKTLHKNMSQYMISVDKNEISEYNDLYEGSDIKYCSFHEIKTVYTKKKGRVSNDSGSLFF